MIGPQIFRAATVHQARSARALSRVSNARSRGARRRTRRAVDRRPGGSGPSDVGVPGGCGDLHPCRTPGRGRLASRRLPWRSCRPRRGPGRSRRRSRRRRPPARVVGVADGRVAPRRAADLVARGRGTRGARRRRCGGGSPSPPGCRCGAGVEAAQPGARCPSGRSRGRGGVDRAVADDVGRGVWSSVSSELSVITSCTSTSMSAALARPVRRSTRVSAMTCRGSAASPSTRAVSACLPEGGQAGDALLDGQEGASGSSSCRARDAG